MIRDESDDDDSSDSTTSPTTGRGLNRDQYKFLPSDPGTLLDRLLVLKGLREAGNDSNNIDDEYIAIVDELLRQGILNTDQHLQLSVGSTKLI